MGTGLSLETIKQQYNLPKNSSVADVMKFAAENNIVIDFSAKDNSAKTVQDNNFFAQPKKNDTLKTSTQKAGDINFGASAFDTAKSGTVGAGENNNSVFGFGSGNSEPSATDLAFKFGKEPSLTEQAMSEFDNYNLGENLRKQHGTSKFNFRLPNLGFLSNVSNDKLDNFIDKSLDDVDNKKGPTVVGDSDSAKVVKTGFSEDGAYMINVLEDGTETKVALTAEEQKIYSKISKKNRVVSTEFIDGKAVMTFANGKTAVRDAMFGEHGYVKNGNSVDDELKAHFGEEFDKAQTKEAKHALIKSYIKDVFLKLSPEEQEEKFKELWKNTDKTSGTGQYLISISKNFGRTMRKQFQSQVIQTRENAKAQQEVAQVAVAENLTTSDVTSQQQRELIEDSAELATNFGVQDTFVEQSAENISKVHDDNAQFITETAIDMNSSLASDKFAKVAENATNTDKALLDAVGGDKNLADKVKSQLQDKVGDLKNAHISVVGDDKVTVCNEQACKEIDIALLDGDVQKALKKVGELDLNTLSDGQAKGIHDGFNSKIKDGTIKKSDAQSVGKVMVSTEAIVQDSDTQRVMIDERNAVIKDADPEIRDGVLVEQGRQGHKYQKENQVYADEQARVIDENSVYNRSVADNVQNYEDKDIQKIIGQKVMDSGDEEALNNFAKHVYDLDESNRDNFVNQLQNSGYDSVNETLNNSRNEYESKKSNNTNKSSDTVETSSDNNRSSSTSSNEVSSSGISAAVKSIISDKTLNSTTKAQRIKTLSPKDQKVAIQQLIGSATTPEIKGYILSGFKSEVFSYLLDNFSIDNRDTLESLKYLMTPKELDKYNSLLENYGEKPQEAKPQEESKKNNFFFKNV